jgi:hypothetical protein
MLLFRAGMLAVTFAVAGSALADTTVSVPPTSAQRGTPYQAELANNCIGAGCGLEFPVVPLKRRLDLSLANCAVEGPGSLTSLAFFLEQGSTVIVSHELVQKQAIASGSTTRRFFGEPVEISIASGRHLSVSVLMNNGPVGLRCSIFGTWVVFP